MSRLSYDDFDDIQRIMDSVKPVTSGKSLKINQIVIENSNGNVVAVLHRSDAPDGPWDVEIS